MLSRCLHRVSQRRTSQCIVQVHSAEAVYSLFMNSCQLLWSEHRSGSQPCTILSTLAATSLCMYQVSCSLTSTMIEKASVPHLSVRVLSFIPAHYRMFTTHNCHTKRRHVQLHTDQQQTLLLRCSSQQRHDRAMHRVCWQPSA